MSDDGGYEEPTSLAEFSEQEVVERGWCYELWEEYQDQLQFMRFYDYYGEDEGT